MKDAILNVTDNIKKRSVKTRSKYLATIQAQADRGTVRASLSCGNLAHTVAACPSSQKSTILDFTKANIGIVTAYNDMLSAHQPYRNYPAIIQKAASDLGHSAQVAGGVPAMCDGVTQGQDGMDLSLFSRDLIAQATAMSLSHNTFDATLLLGVCDKIAPGQLMGALAFGHLPTAFVPSGPMGTGISNKKKVEVRQKYAAGEAGDKELLDVECRSYHSPGTCTFYGTANTNQLVFEAMGLMLPGCSFVAPNSALREALTQQITREISAQTASSKRYRPLAEIVDEKSVVNGLVALLASGGSTNHTIHLVAVVRAAGWVITWDDIDALSSVVPLLAQMYPNGPADINDFQNAGGVPTLIKTLAERGLFYLDATPVFGTMNDYMCYPTLESGGALVYKAAPDSLDAEVIARPGKVFNPHGGIKLLDGNLGRGVMKVSAVAPNDQTITAPARVFDSQHDVESAYLNGEFTHDVIVVLRHNGPASNGMPELHKLMPILGNVMKAGHKVALVTDGRLSGASGKVPAVIHVTPEATRGGPLAQIEDGDVIEVNAQAGLLNCQQSFEHREATLSSTNHAQLGSGRELFHLFRQHVSSAEQGASILYPQ
jgi:phosphogluconate dehydratase